MSNQAIFGVIGKVVSLSDLASHKREGFKTKQSDLLIYNNKPFEIVRSLEETDVDLVVAPMFRVRFEDGFETDAYLEEVYQDSVFDVITEKNLVRE